MLGWSELEEIARAQAAERDRLLSESSPLETAGDASGVASIGVGARLAAFLAVFAASGRPGLYQQDYHALVEGRLSAYLT